MEQISEKNLREVISMQWQVAKKHTKKLVVEEEESEEVVEIMDKAEAEEEEEEEEEEKEKEKEERALECSPEELPGFGAVWPELAPATFRIHHLERI